MAVDDWRNFLARVVGRVRDALPGMRGRRETRVDWRAPSREAWSSPPRHAAAQPAAVDSAPDDEAVIAVADRDRSLLVSWAVAEGAIARARAVLGEEGCLAARVVLVAPDDDVVVRNDVREKTPVHARGEWRVDDVPARSHCTASIGLLGAERFVSVAHAPVVRSRGS